MDPLRRLTNAQRFAIARQLRRAASPAERYAWSLLRNRGVLALKFRRQHVLHGFIVDFYCAARRLVLELEGDAHDPRDRQAYDTGREAGGMASEITPAAPVPTPGVSRPPRACGPRPPPFPGSRHPAAGWPR